MPSALAEAKEVRPNVHIAADEGKLNILTGTALDFFTSEVHSTDFNALSFYIFLNALVSCIEDLANGG